MTLVKHAFPNPSFVRSFDDLFTRGSFVPSGRTNWNNTPSVNVKETDAAFHIEMAAPGMNKEDFKIAVKEETLIISSERKSNNEQKTERYTRKEWNYSAFSRKFSLPENINAAEIVAEYENGVLKVILPKVEQKTAENEIEVKIK
ncbi:MAG: Hsp20/alpha crystallin family protein [Flavobacteriales bacterium]|nr:Hsp20/alpha crystallin family protein [Flavobacteriales bacterium]